LKEVFDNRVDALMHGLLYGSSEVESQGDRDGSCEEDPKVLNEYALESIEPIQGSTSG